MKSIILKILRKYFNEIIEYWSQTLLKQFGDKVTEIEIVNFVKNSLEGIIKVIETSDYTKIDHYLIESYNLFIKAKLNLLEISQFFSQGRYALLTHLEKENSAKFDSLVLLGFLDEIMEQIFARYGMLHQEVQMKELAGERDRLASKLESNQHYLLNILHASDSAIIVIDENEKIMGWNKGAEKIFGYTESEVIGKPSSFLLPPHETYYNELNEIKNEIINKGQYKITETERMTKKGEKITVRLSVNKLLGKNGNYAGRTVIIEDNTEVKKLQNQVDQSEKLAVIGQLAAGVAHEIGNPLTSISSIVQILQRKSTDPFYKEQLANIKENIDRISKIVRELVDFSRPPSDKKSPTQITDIIKTAIGIVKYDKRVKKVDFKVKLSTELPFVEIVPDRLLQVFVNILINALDAINGTGVVSVESFNDDAFVYVKICDDGIGIEPEIMEKLFEPFFTTKEVGKGTGLGLSISYGIVKKFGGDIIVESEPGKGSCFTVKLPIELKRGNTL
jgi:PAS domain S-box-containing protein